MNPTPQHRILWAQRSSATHGDQNFVLLRICPSIKLSTKTVKVQLSEDGIKLRAKGFQIDLGLYDHISEGGYKRMDMNNCIGILVLKKNLSNRHWPCLLKPLPSFAFDSYQIAIDNLCREPESTDDQDWGLVCSYLSSIKISCPDDVYGEPREEKAKPISFRNRPVNFETWLARSQRNTELRNSEASLLLRMPPELRYMFWEFALANIKVVRLFDGLLDYGEDQFAHQLSRLGNQLDPDGYDYLFEYSRLFSYNEKGEEIKNYFKKPPNHNRGVGLFTTSRAVSRESLEVMYRKTRFVFPDRYGIIGLKCFLYTIGQKNTNNLRKITIHMPPWRFPKGSDKQRASYIYVSAAAHGLREAKRHRDPLLGSFREVIAKLSKIKNLRELDIQLSPVVTNFFHAKMRLPKEDDEEKWRVMCKRRQPKYLARSVAEPACLQMLRDLAPRLKVRFVALEYTTDNTEMFEEGEGEDKEEQVVRYWRLVEEKCKGFGFEYVKVKSRSQEPPEPPEQGEDQGGEDNQASEQMASWLDGSAA